MRNRLKINDSRRGARDTRAAGNRRGCDSKKFFCIFFRISELRYFVISKICLKTGHLNWELDRQGVKSLIS